MVKLKIYWWFWGMIPLFLIFSLIYSDSILYIPLENWSTLFPLNYYGIGVALFLFFSGLGYFIKSFEFKSKLTLLHFITTVLGLFILILPKLYFLIFASRAPRRYYSTSVVPSFIDFISEMNLVSQLAMALIIFGIITYLFNLGFAIFKNKT